MYIFIEYIRLSVLSLSPTRLHLSHDTDLTHVTLLRAPASLYADEPDFNLSSPSALPGLTYLTPFTFTR